MLAGAASSYGPAPLRTWVVSGGASGGTRRGGRRLRVDRVRRRRLRLHRPRDGQLRLARRDVRRAHVAVAGRRRERLRGRAGRQRRLVHRRLVRLDRHPRTPTTSRTSRPTARSTPAWPASTDGPVYTLADRRARPCSPAASSTDAGGCRRARRSRRSTATTGSRDEPSTRASPATGRSSRRSSSRARRSTWAARSTRSAARRATTSARSTWRAARRPPGTRDANDLVNAIAVGPDANTVYVGGFFQTVNGDTARTVSPRPSTRPGPDDGQRAGTRTPTRAVYAVEVVGLDGLPRRRVRARRRPGAGRRSPPSTRPTGARDELEPERRRRRLPARRLGLDRLRGGSFQNVNDSTPPARQRRRLQRGATGAPTAFSPMVGGDVFALGRRRARRSSSAARSARRAATPGNPAPVRRDNIAAIDLTTGQPTSWNPRTNDTVFALAVSGSTVYAGGAFTTVNGATVAEPPGGVRRDGRRRDRPGTRTSNDTVFALTRARLDRLRGRRVHDRERRRVAAQPTWRPSPPAGPARRSRAGTRTRTASSTRSTRSEQHDLPRRRLHRRSAATAERTARRGRRERGALQTWNPDANNTVYALAHVGSTEYAGGAFTAVNGNVSRGGAAALRRATGAATSWDPRLVLDSGDPADRLSRSRPRSRRCTSAASSTARTPATAPRTASSRRTSPRSRSRTATRSRRGSRLPNGVVNALAVAPQAARRRAAPTARSATRPPARRTPPTSPTATYRGGFALLPGLPDAPIVTATAGDASATVTVQRPPTSAAARSSATR